MNGWKSRLLALLTVTALLTSIARPAVAYRGDDCRRFHGDRYCEVDSGDRGVHRFRYDYYDYYDYNVFYPFYYPYFFPYYSYYYNGCGFDWGGPVNPYDCWD